MWTNCWRSSRRTLLFILSITPMWRSCYHSCMAQQMSCALSQQMSQHWSNQTDSKVRIRLDWRNQRPDAVTLELRLQAMRVMNTSNSMCIHFEFFWADHVSLGASFPKELLRKYSIHLVSDEKVCQPCFACLHSKSDNRSWHWDRSLLRSMEG